MTGASDLALSKAGVMHDKDDGIFVDKCQRTSTYHIMAAGVCVCVCVLCVRACVRVEGVCMCACVCMRVFVCVRVHV